MKSSSTGTRRDPDYFYDTPMAFSWSSNTTSRRPAWERFLPNPDDPDEIERELLDVLEQQQRLVQMLADALDREEALERE